MIIDIPLVLAGGMFFYDAWCIWEQIVWLLVAMKININH